MSTNEERVLDHLKSIFPKGETNSDISEATIIGPHSQVFQLTQKLIHKGFIRGERENGSNGEWKFFAIEINGSNQDSTITTYPTHEIQIRNTPDHLPLIVTPYHFEKIAQKIMSETFQKPLSPKYIPGVPKKFDLVSDDFSIIGDVKYYTLVRGSDNPPAKFSTIAEYVWLLEKTKAITKFLVFGNDIRVPEIWLKKYGSLVINVGFYFISDDGKLTQLR